MTVYEHAMIGINGALALGLSRCQGWPIVALAGVAAILPDLDGLTILLGPHLYAEGHRLWGHNLLVVGIVATFFSAIVYQTDAMRKVQRWLARRLEMFAGAQPAEVPRNRASLMFWIVVGVFAAYSHLFMDVLFSGGKNLPIWGVPLLWPFSNAVWAYPLVPWGDVGTTVIFAVSMFAMLRWPARIRSIATGSLVLVAAYLMLRSAFWQWNG
jgi:membrane-bound metal-dependent hydrolase YbcI (DUF457 family)